MRKVREILRLTYDAGLPSREVARRVGVGSTGVRMMLQRFRASKLEWPLADRLTDTALELELYCVAAKRGSWRGRHEPDWTVVNRDLKRKHVTLQVRWNEYIEAYPDGYRFSRFCELYRSWEGRLPVTMRQTHLGGDRMFVDYTGDTVSVVVDRLTGEIRDPKERSPPYVIALESSGGLRAAFRSANDAVFHNLAGSRGIRGRYLAAAGHVGADVAVRYPAAKCGERDCHLFPAGDDRAATGRAGRGTGPQDEPAERCLFGGIRPDGAVAGQWPELAADWLNHLLDCRHS